MKFILKIIILLLLFVLILYMCSDIKMTLMEIGQLNHIRFHDESRNSQFQNWLDGQKNQKEKIREICAKYGERANVQKLHSRRLLHLEKYNLFSCPNNKVCV